MPLKDRIATIIKVNNHTAASFAQVMGVQRSNVSHILNGRNKPSLDFIEKLLESFPGIDPTWLLTGSETNQHSPPKPHSSAMASHAQADLPHKTGPKKAEGERQILRIILLYTDGSFENFETDSL